MRTSYSTCNSDCCQIILATIHTKAIKMISFILNIRKHIVKNYYIDVRYYWTRNIVNRYKINKRRMVYKEFFLLICLYYVNHIKFNEKDCEIIFNEKVCEIISSVKAALT